MKKLNLIIACCIGLMLLASCKKDPVAPTISVFNGSGYAAENSEYYSGDEINVGFVATGENLTKLEVKVSQDGTELASHFETIEKAATYTYSHSFVINAAGTVTITGTVTDAVGQTATKSFNVICNEKPNKKFLGDYEGTALVSGSFILEITGMEPYQEDFTDRESTVYVGITEGENDNEVIAECHVNDHIFTVTGTVDGNTITANDIHDTFTLNYEYNGMTISPEIDVIYNLTATLDGDMLTFEGTYEGNGDVNVFIFSGTINLDGTFSGSLNKLPPI